MDSRPYKVAFFNLGCRLNQYETDSLAGSFSKAGFEIIKLNQTGADVCVINTCTVTARGDQKSRQAVGRLKRLQPQALFVVTGCAVENSPEKFSKFENTILVNQDKKYSIPQLVISRLKDLKPDLGSLLPDRFGFKTPQVSLHTRASLKVQDGCDNQCSYCVIPRVRGPAISRPFADCLKNALELIKFGYREIVITGVNLQQYSDQGQDLADLVAALLELPGEQRFRLSSIEPEPTSFKLIDLFNNPKLCPHLHLCLQSGSNQVLKAMSRKYQRELIHEIADGLRQVNPLFNLTADIIVGFPGESAKDFSETLELVDRLALSHAHTFQFSPREGTPAASLGQRIDAKLTRERSQAVRELVKVKRRHYLERLIGEPERLLIEETNPATKIHSGYGRYYVPLEVANPPDGRLQQTNNFLDCKVVEIVSGKSDSLRGSAVVRD